MPGAPQWYDKCLHSSLVCKEELHHKSQRQARDGNHCTAAHLCWRVRRLGSGFAALHSSALLCLAGCGTAAAGAGGARAAEPAGPGVARGRRAGGRRGRRRPRPPVRRHHRCSSRICLLSSSGNICSHWAASEVKWLAWHRRWVVLAVEHQHQWHLRPACWTLGESQAMMESVSNTRLLTRGNTLSGATARLENTGLYCRPCRHFTVRCMAGGFQEGLTCLKFWMFN